MSDLAAYISSGWFRPKVCSSLIVALEMLMTVSMSMKIYWALLMNPIRNQRFKPTKCGYSGLLLGMSNST